MTPGIGESAQEDLFAAIGNGDSKGMEAALKAHASLTVLDEKKRPALIRLVCQMEATPEMVSLLLEWGADVDATEGWFGSTALSFALQATPRRPDIARVLLDANPDLSGPSGWDGVTLGEMLAMQCVHHEELSALLPWFLDRNILPRMERGQFGVLQSAIRNGTRDPGFVVLGQLLAAGFSPDGEEADAESPLISAFFCRAMPAARMLLEAGANPDLPPRSFGRSPHFSSIWEYGLLSSNSATRETAQAVFAWYEERRLETLLPGAASRKSVIRI